MKNEQLSEFITKMYFEIQKCFNGLNGRFDDVANRIAGLENEIHKANLTIEDEVKPKLQALLDVYKQNNYKLDRTEE